MSKKNQSKGQCTKSGCSGGATMRTTVIVNYDCGLPNTLYIRGEGIPSLSWDNGTPLHNVRCDEWIWETDETFDAINFKILLNDQTYEFGEDHQLIC